MQSVTREGRSITVKKAKNYYGQQIVLATQHQKERALSLPFRRHLGAEIVVVQLDTDQFGTFSGEVERVGSPEAVAIAKAELGIKKSGKHLSLASEGSFGPSPYMPLANSDTEVLVFLDSQLKLKVIEREHSLKTNLASCLADPQTNLTDFLKHSQFGSHALVVRPNSGTPFTKVIKGIRDLEELTKGIAECSSLSNDGKAHVETDMRAHMNPTRMRVIRHLGFKMAKRLRTFCPECQAPGWGMVGTQTGLPCDWCGFETQLVWKEIFGCSRCGHQEKKQRADRKESAAVEHCPKCNP